MHKSAHQSDLSAHFGISLPLKLISFPFTSPFWSRRCSPSHDTGSTFLPRSHKEMTFMQTNKLQRRTLESWRRLYKNVAYEGWQCDWESHMDHTPLCPVYGWMSRKMGTKKKLKEEWGGRQFGCSVFTLVFFILAFTASGTRKMFKKNRLGWWMNNLKN